jgi:hypothetical protein
VVRGGVRSIVSGIVSTGKDAVVGVSEGITEGRRGGESLDGARLVAGKAEFEKLLSASVLRLEETGENRYKLTAAVKNDNSFPVRITGLADPLNVMLLDKDGFSSPALVGDLEATALPRSSTRLVFNFDNVEGDPGVFRLFDVDVDVPESVKKQPEGEG